MVEEKKNEGDQERPPQLSKMTSCWLDGLIGKITEIVPADLPKIELLELTPMDRRSTDPDAARISGESGEALVARATGGNLASAEVLVELSAVHRFMRGEMREAEAYRDVGLDTNAFDDLTVLNSDGKPVEVESHPMGMTSLDASERLIREHFAQALDRTSEALEARLSEPIASSENKPEETLKPVTLEPIILTRGEEIKKEYYENALKRTLERLYQSIPPDRAP
ncbi:MAG: hypothetical protein CFH05_00549 [Alphaproteobacteria bacterium MarineAlpha3_Bin4]|nr:MAG: hypothetical protein CFH05_00549 [Alphaproteobacteria bacterium MarineAlpha3_Bin4]